MKATGIVDRMDDMGRVIIPREIRHSLGLTGGTPFEIYLDNGGICFVPYHRDLSEELEALRIKVINDYKLTKRDLRMIDVINDLFDQISDLMEE